MLRPSRVLLIALLSLLLPAAPALAAPAGTGRYYVVGPPVHGQPDYLYAIAVTTLHNGNRYQEIFRLNQGRAQPDGSRLTDPAEVLHPGWVLALPKDARGPRVLTGPLPLDAPSSSPVAAPPPAPVTTRPAANGEPLLTYGGLTLAVLLVGFAVVVLRRRPSETSALAVPASSVRGGPSAPAPPRMPAPARGRNSGPAPTSDLARTADAGPGPTAYARPGATAGLSAALGTAYAGSGPTAYTRPGIAAAGPSTEPGTAYAGPGAAAVGSGTAADRSAAASHAGLGTTAHAGPGGAAQTGPGATPHTGPGATASAGLGATARAGLGATARAELGATARAELGATARAGAGATAHAGAGATAQSGVRAGGSTAFAGPGVSARSKLVAMPAAPAGSLDLREELRCGGVPAALRLLGGRGPVPYIWLSPGLQPPAGRPGVVLGRGAGGRLWVDLSAAPDVLTVTGDPAAGLRQARALIDQLYADGTPFTVVGNALEASPLEVDPATPQVLICAGVPPHEMPALLARVRASAGRLLPILVGDVPAARWSLSFPENA